MEKPKEEIIELEDTVNDTPIFIYDNTTPKCTNSNILDNLSKSKDILNSNHYSYKDKNSDALNGIKIEKIPENQIMCQRENRRLISMIKKMITKKENNNNNITKENIKNMLINYKNDITLLKDDKKNTLLHIFVEENDIDAINIILEVYLDMLKLYKNYFYFIFSKNFEDKNVFDIAVQKGNIQIIKLLYTQIEKGGNYNEKTIYMKYLRDNIFNIAARNNHIFPILFFYEKLSLFYDNRGFFKEKEILDIHEINEDKFSPIHYACKNRNVKLMKILIDLGANINSQDGKGYTPLHHAVINNDERMVKHLLIRGANKFIKDHNNLTPYDLSFELEEQKLSSILYHKNFCQRYFCEEELGPISKKNNMLSLFIGVISTIIIKLLTIFRFFILNNIFQDYSILNSFNCLDDNCGVDIGILFFTLGIDLLLLIMFLIFRCSKEIFLEQKKMSNKSLSVLYEENEKICIKCHIHINDNIQHCLICDRCVENWDHHCYWLNTCINDKNYKKF